VTAQLLPLLLVPIAVVAGAFIGMTARGRGRLREQGDTPARILMASFPNGALLLFDRRLRHTLAAGRGLGGLGLSREQVEQKTVREVFPPEVCAILEPAYRAALEGQETSLELPYADRDHLVRIGPVRERTGGVGGGVVVTQDVTERKRREHRLSELASRDGLTGLWNRRRLSEELEWLLGQASRGGARAGSLLLVDLDGFKRVNDTLGHDAGDELLRKVARSIEGQVRRTDGVARLGGDEFAVLLPDAAPEEAERVAAKIAPAIHEIWPSAVQGGASIGIAAIGEGNWSVAAVLSSADRAMYGVKRAERLRTAS
jgi:diguanylate cyclase (GGDEF)-like protein/PAS domain S-box-containing protein